MSDSEQQPTSWTTPQGAEAASEPATQDSAQDTPQPTSPINFHTDEAASLAEIKGGLGSDHQVRVAGQGFAQDLSREGQGHFAAAQLETGSQAKVQAMAVGTNGSALDVANPSVQANSEQKPGQASALDPLTGTVGADALAFGQTASGHQGNEANLTGAARSEKTSADSALSGQSSELSQPSVSQATAGQSTLVAAQTLRTPTGPSYSTSASGGQAYLGSQVGGDQASAGGSGAIPPYGQAGPALHPTVMAKPKSHKVLGQTAKNFWMCLVVAVVCCILTVCVLFFTGHLGSTSYVSGGSSGSNITINPSDADSTTLPEAVAAKVTPSVVNIDVYQAQSSQPSSIWDLFGNGSGSGSSSSNSSTLTKTSLGSGIVISADGYILTCAHVVSGADKLMVTFDENQPQLEAKVVGVDTEDDIAVIKVNASGLTPISVGDSDAVKVGEWVMAVGSPYGLEKSVSTGIVSAKYRSTTVQSESQSGSSTGESIYANMIQTDAAINPGNSGGALVDEKGALIGINAVIASNSDSNAGVGFAIPVNYAMNIANQLMKGQTVQHAYMGVSLADVNAQTAKQLGISATSGAYVASVVAGSPAEQAGIKKGDVITKIDDETIASADEVIISVREHNIGDKVEVTVQRGNSTQVIGVTLGSDLKTKSDNS